MLWLLEHESMEIGGSNVKPRGFIDMGFIAAAGKMLEEIESTSVETIALALSAALAIRRVCRCMGPASLPLVGHCVVDAEVSCSAGP